jgi:alkylhydroperoxidase family enzyme
VRFAVARQEGLTEEKVARITDDHEHTGLDERERAILDYTDAFVLAPGPPPQGLQERLLAHLQPEQVLELTLALAAFVGFSKLRIALGLEPDDMPVRVVPTPDVPAEQEED